MRGTVSFLRQTMPGAPTFTDANVEDLKGKVVVVTGSNTGMGKELARFLYAKNAKVYMMARSETKTRQAMAEIRDLEPLSTGELVYIATDLADLRAVTKAATDLLRRETRLDLLFNNAGVGYPEPGSESKQGYELQFGVNCLGTFALTQRLEPLLVSTAKRSPPGSVRVVWVTSNAAEAVNPASFEADLANIKAKSSFEQYCVSKFGAYLHAAEFARRHRAAGILSTPLNPGALDSDFWRTTSSKTTWLLRKTVLYPPRYGAYTALFAGFSPEVDKDTSGSYVTAWGRFWDIPQDMRAATMTEAEGGTGLAERFWKWTEDQAKLHA